MSYDSNQNPYQAPAFDIAARAGVSERGKFIINTYAHLIGAILALVGLEAILLSTSLGNQMLGMIMGNRFAWLIIIGMFIGVSYIAETWARSNTSKGMQYMGLGLYVAAESIILLPLLTLAMIKNPSLIASAAWATIIITALLSITVFITRKDFSFLRGILVFGSFAVLGLIVLSIFTSFSLGPIFIYAVIALSCGYILYQTSNIMLHYRTDQHVAASLALFASVALLFYYILMLFMSRE